MAARIANMKQGERTDLPSIDGKSVSLPQAAEMMSVGEASVQRARKVIATSDEDLVEAVNTGEMAVSVAVKTSIAVTRPSGVPADVRVPRTGILLYGWALRRCLPPPA